MKRRESVGVSSKTQRKSLSEMLVEQKFITPEQLGDALKLQQEQGGGSATSW